jgi:hypothetical protein
MSSLLKQLNNDFGTKIDEEQIDDLATEIYLDLQSESGQGEKWHHGLQSFELFRKATYEKLMKQYFITEFLSGSEDVNDLDEAKLAAGIAKLVAQKLSPYAKISETQTAGGGGGSSIESAAPEHTIEVVNGKESLTLQERIDLRKQLNSITDENMRLRRLREEAADDKSAYNQVRYKLQKFTNGGTPYIDENGTPKVDGEKGGPSSYEAWRAGINNTKRDARLKLEQEERDSPFASPKHTTQPDPKTVLDGQIDEYLAFITNKYGEYK